MPGCSGQQLPPLLRSIWFLGIVVPLQRHRVAVLVSDKVRLTEQPMVEVGEVVIRMNLDGVPGTATVCDRIKG